MGFLIGNANIYKEEWTIMLIDTTIMTANEISDIKLLPVLNNINLKFTKKI